MTLLLRLGQGVAIIWLAATVAFLALRVLPGDAISAQMAFSGASPEVIAQRQSIMGLTAPLTEQYIRFVGGLFVGELGYSLLDGQPVLTKISQQVIPTVTLATGALIFAVIIGVGLGVAAVADLMWGIRPVAQITIDLALSMPIYWTGTLAIYLFTVGLGLLPSSGAGGLSQLVLPVSVLGFHTGGAIARVTAANLRDVSKADFVRTAYAKGLSRKAVFLHHILPVGLPSIITVIALQAGFLLSGTVITESLFVRPGLGRLLLDSVLWQDYPVVQGIVVFSAIVYVMLSVAADICYRLADPRVAVV